MLTHHRCDRISRNDPKQDKNHERDTEQHDNRLQYSFSDTPQHMVSFLNVVVRLLVYP